MTNDELQQYYADLLILQYRGKAKAEATVKILAELIISNQLPISVRDAFDLSTAIGTQLDDIGKYANVVRSIGNVELTDDDFRVLIQLAIIKNNSESSTYAIQALLQIYFEDIIFFFDYKTMRVGYYIDADTWTEDLAQAAILQDLLPYPMAVERGAIIYATSSYLSSFFGMRTYLSEAVNSSPMNDYSDYQYDWPWLRYEYSNTPANQAVYFLLDENGNYLTTESGEGIYI